MKKILILFISIIIAFTSCDENCGECPPSPEMLSITFLHRDSVVDPVYAGMIMPDSVQLTYQDGDKIKPVHWNVFLDEARGQVHFQMTEIGYLCRKGMEDFDLKVNGITTHIKIKFRQKTDSEKCCTRYVADVVTIDGTKMYLDELPDYGGILVEIEL